MQRKPFFSAVLVSIACAGLGRAKAQHASAPAPEPLTRFAAPVLLQAGEKLMGARRLYPSPALHDLNGDGLADVVLGDLPGRITAALRLAGDGPARFGPDEPLLAQDGKPLDFQNW
jgi:hypothetical protein